MTKFDDFYRRSIEQPEAFWLEQARLVDWATPPQVACDYSEPPFARWFPDARTNLCHNAVDRHLPERSGQPALIFVSTETNQEQTFTYGQLHEEVQAMAGVLKAMGVAKGDRVLIYMPMIPEAVFAMLACARIGAIHCVVFGGFASHALATRIEDATPKVVLSADAGSRGGKVVPYKQLLDAAIELARHKPEAVVLIDRGLAGMAYCPGRDHDYRQLREQQGAPAVPCEWVESGHPSYVLYTSGTTGKPKGVQRDTGGHAVALAASMKHIYGGKAGETFFAASDIGWVVGHSYIVYGPLLAGMATILYEGLPIRPDAGIWWQLVERHKVSVMFSAPTAIRVLKKHDPAFLQRHDLSSLKRLFLAGEPLDEPTARWITEGLGKPVIDNYWQTETGWPILTLCNGIEVSQPVLGSPGQAVYGYRVKLLDPITGAELHGSGQRGVLAMEGPLPPGCMQTVWGDDHRYVDTYWSTVPNRLVYSTFDLAMRDEAGNYFILGRTDDVINVAGHRLGTREIEESIGSHSAVAETAVVGVQDALKGQIAVAFVVLRDGGRLADALAIESLEREIARVVETQLGAVARPAKIHFVAALPKTRSGKLLRRAIQAVCEGRDTGDLSTMEDPAALRQISALVQRQPFRAPSQKE